MHLLLFGFAQDGGVVASAEHLVPEGAAAVARRPAVHVDDDDQQGYQDDDEDAQKGGHSPMLLEKNKIILEHGELELVCGTNLFGCHGALDLVDVQQPLLGIGDRQAIVTPV